MIPQNPLKCLWHPLVVPITSTLAPQEYIHYHHHLIELQSVFLCFTPFSWIRIDLLKVCFTLCFQIADLSHNCPHCCCSFKKAKHKKTWRPSAPSWGICSPCTRQRCGCHQRFSCRFFIRLPQRPVNTLWPAARITIIIIGETIISNIWWSPPIFFENLHISVQKSGCRTFKAFVLFLLFYPLWELACCTFTSFPSS